MWGSIFGGGGGNRPDALRFAQLSELRGYWEALRTAADGAIPERNRIDPRGIGGALDVAFIADRVAPGVARLRLAGSVLCDLMGMDVRGMPLLSLIEPRDRAGLAEAVETALMQPAVLTLALAADRGIGRPPLEARLLMLPLRRADGSAGLALGCLAIDGQIGRAPRRFFITRRLIEALGPAQRRDLAAAESAAESMAVDKAPGLAEAPAVFAGRPPCLPPVRGRPHLRLVQGGAAARG